MRFLSFLLSIAVVLVSSPTAAQADDLREISAKSAVVIDADTGEVVFGKNENERLPMASTTKIMSALLVLESGGLDEEFIVDSDAIKTEGSSMGLREGDKVTLRELCCGMLLPSGNDAANAAAVRVAGSVDEFVDLMNEKARELGLENTHFVTPSGLDDHTDEHYSSAADMAKLASEAIKNPEFREICSSPSMSVEFGAPPYSRVLYNTNKLLDSCEGVFGVKTGFTDKAGRCLVSACERDGKTLICVTLNDRNDWEDHRALYDRCYGYYSRQVLSESGKVFDVPVVGGTAGHISCIADRACVLLLRDRASLVRAKVYVQPFVYAPVKSGDVVGHIVYSYNGAQIARADIRAGGAVSRYKGDDNDEPSFFELLYHIFELIV